jgi:hypothetical protein
LPRPQYPAYSTFVIVNTAPADHELLISGDETVEELRKAIGQISHHCPLDKVHEKCPFRMFGLLNPQVRDNLINAMTIEACLHFFELERECRASADRQSNKSPAKGG